MRVSRMSRLSLRVVRVSLMSLGGLSSAPEALSSERVPGTRQAEAAAGTFTARDVVLPLPGRAVDLVYPRNAAGRRFRRMLDREGVRGSVVDPAAAAAAAPAGGTSAKSGGGETRACLFRFLMERPVDLEWELLPYVKDAVRACASERASERERQRDIVRRGLFRICLSRREAGQGSCDDDKVRTREERDGDRDGKLGGPRVRVCLSLR